MYSIIVTKYVFERKKDLTYPRCNQMPNPWNTYILPIGNEMFDWHFFVANKYKPNGVVKVWFYVLHSDNNLKM